MIFCIPSRKGESIMLKRTSAALDAFRDHLEAREYSPATVAKYVHDVRALMI